MSLRAGRLLPAAVLVALLGAGGASAATPPATTWFVQAGAAPGGAGTRERPLDSLAAAERVSAPGQRIVVLASARGVAPLDGGIALKPGQRLRGDGPLVVALDDAGHARLHARLRRMHRAGHRRLPRRRGAARTRAHRALHGRMRRVHRAPHRPRGGALPRITNTTGERQHGDAVRLAEGAVVENLVIVDPFRAGIYGSDVASATVRGNDVSGHNTSCASGFHIQPFRAPTSVPGVQLPISAGLTNGFAGIMLDARSAKSAVRIDRNHVHDAECGDGIDLRAHGTADVRAELTANLVEHLTEDDRFESLLAFGLQTLDRGRLDATLEHNRVHDIGNGPPTPAGADSEGLFANLDDRSAMKVAVDDFTYTNPRGVGGFSANGMELVTTGGSPQADMVIRNSSFSGSPGDVIEEANLGTGSRMSLVLDNVAVSRSTGLGNLYAIPFNNGDCVLAGSGDANNELALRIVDSELTNCVNNGLSILSANTGSTIDVAVARTRITGHRGINLWARDTGELKRLAIAVEDSALCNAGGTNVQIENDAGASPPGAVDLGGGALGSAGRNDLSGGVLQARVQNVDVTARNAWWGSPAGPALGRALALGGALDSAEPLGAPPAVAC